MRLERDCNNRGAVLVSTYSRRLPKGRLELVFVLVRSSQNTWNVCELHMTSNRDPGSEVTVQISVMSWKSQNGNA